MTMGQANGAPKLPHLSPREQEALLYLLLGYSEKQVADAMEISLHTVHLYVKVIYREYRVATRAELLSTFIWLRAAETPQSPEATCPASAS